ncbi:MAG: ABC transporter permease [Acidobacteria bacterium]|nr:ABC transporter permease [Acidobacteriota bacterium]
MRSDFLFAWRQLRRNPGFGATAVLCLGLGIGATSAIFSVVNAVVLRPLPYADSGALVRVYSEWPNWPGGGMWKFWISPPEFNALRRDNKAFETLDAWQTGGANLAPASSDPVRVSIASVSGTLMQTLGVPPLRGRWLQPADDAEGAPMQVVLSYGLWQGAFGGRDQAVGRDVLINGTKATIAGVMPRGFHFPPGETNPAELWAPLQLTGRDMERWGNHRLSLVGRLRPGMSVANAAQDLDRLEREYSAAAGPNQHRPNPRTHTLAGFSLLDETVGNVRPAMLMLLGATALVLLIACGNVANLLLARAQARQKEVAVRQALGATAASLFRQFFLEGLLLSLGAAVLGLGLAFLILRLILMAGGESIPRSSEIWMDGAVLAFALAAAFVTGIVFALAPMAQTIRAKLFDTLKAAGGRTTATREAHWLRSALVAGEIALAVVLLAGAGLLLDTFWNLMKTDPGVRAERWMSMRVSLPQQGYPQPADAQRFWREAGSRIRALPGVANVAVLSSLPPQRPINANDTFIEGLTAKPEGPFHNVDYWNGALPGTFEALGVSLLRGRLFEPRDGDGAPRVLVVNQAFEKHFYGGESAVGRRVKPGGSPSDDSPWYTIVGVVKDVKNQGMDRPAGTELWFSLPQSGAVRAATLLVESAQPDPWAILPSVRDTIRDIDPALPLAQVRPLEEAIASANARPRFLALLLTLFAAVALGLAATGIFSVMLYTVAQRTNEFGVRLALGASAAQVLGLVMRQGARLVAVGMVFGLTGGWVLTRTLRASVPALGELRWVPLAATVAILAVVTMAACWTPARRATQVDPSTALRAD